jgi:hypothetical protein
MHWGISPGYLKDENSLIHSGEFFGPLKVNINEKNYNESLAQIYTNYMCSDKQDLWNVFIWLEAQQPDEYKIYNQLFLDMDLHDNEFLSHPIKRISEHDIQKIDECVKVCRQENWQQFYFLKRIKNDLPFLKGKNNLKQILSSIIFNI